MFLKKFICHALALALPLVAFAQSNLLTTQTSYENIADAVSWISPNGQQTLLIASLEADGIAVYDKFGVERQHITALTSQGADVRYNMRSSGHIIDILATALPEENSIAFYQVDGSADQPLTALGQFAIDIAPEGVCLYQDPTTGVTSAAAFSKQGDLAQYRLDYDGKKVSSHLWDEQGNPKPVRLIHVGGELSGCVADDEAGVLYIAEQNVGIWRYGADPENVKDRALIDVAKPLGHLVEVENLELALQDNGQGYLMVADESQGFVFYNRSTGQYITQFDLDGIEEAKLVTPSAAGLWIGNTEADRPVYQFFSSQQLETLTGIDLSSLRSPRDGQSQQVALVPATAETQPVSDDGDAADDSAVWYNQASPEQSLIIATNKQGGLMAYRLDGAEVQSIASGKPNNVDIRQGLFAGDGFPLDIAAASNRALNTIALYSITDSKAPIQPIAATGDNLHPNAAELLSHVDEIYGLCMSVGNDGTPFVFVNGKGGEVEQWRLQQTKAGIEGEIVRSWQLNSQPEGCVVDDSSQTLYIGEEDYGIWAFDASPAGSTEPRQVAVVDGETLVDDVEGLTIYQSAQQHYLIASSQGNNTYSVYDLNHKNIYLGSFAIVSNDAAAVDGASDTDGIYAISMPLGSDYPQGLFIAQDWYNIDPQYRLQNQNFKIVDWLAIERQLVLKTKNL